MSNGSCNSGCKRADLSALISGLQVKLQRIRQHERICRQTTAQRKRSEAGERSQSLLVLLRIIEKYSNDERLLITVAKLLLPQHKKYVELTACGTDWKQNLRERMDRQDVTAVVDNILGNRAALQHMRVIKRAKRLVAEYKVFQKVISWNQKGVAPKRAFLVQWLRQHWHHDDDDADEFLDNLSSNKKASKWLERFKCFWQLRWSKLPVRGNMSPEEQSRKVSSGNVHNFCKNWVPFQ